MRKTWIVASAVLFGAAAAAQPPIVVTAQPSRVVSFADLNIGSQAGQNRLVHRIRAAARDLCLENNVEQVKFTVARRECYVRATTDGYSQMNSAIAARDSGASLAAATLTIRGR